MSQGLYYMPQGLYYMQQGLYYMTQGLYYMLQGLYEHIRLRGTLLTVCMYACMHVHVLCMPACMCSACMHVLCTHPAVHALEGVLCCTSPLYRGSGNPHGICSSRARPSLRGLEFHFET